MGPLTPHVFAVGGDEDTDTLDKRVSSLGVVGSQFSRGHLLALCQSWLIIDSQSESTRGSRSGIYNFELYG